MAKPLAGDGDSVDEARPDKSQGAGISQDERGAADSTETPFETDGSKEPTPGIPDGAPEGSGAPFENQLLLSQISPSEPSFFIGEVSKFGTSGDLYARTEPADTMGKATIVAASKCKSVPQGSIATEIETPATATSTSNQSAFDCAKSPRADASQRNVTTISKNAKSYPKEGPLCRSRPLPKEGDELQPHPRSKSLEGRQKIAEPPGRVSSPPCSPRPNSFRLARSRSLPGPRSVSKAGHPQELGSPTDKKTAGDSLVRKEPPREEATNETCTALKSPTRSSKVSALPSPKKQGLQKPRSSANANGHSQGSLSLAPLSPRTPSNQPTVMKARVSSRSSSTDLALASQKLISKQKPQVIHAPGAQSPRINLTVPGSSPSKHPRGVFTPQPLQIAVPPRHTPIFPGTLSPTEVSKSPVFSRDSGALSPTGGPLSPPRTLRRSSVLSSSAESEPGASSPPTSPESAARAERLRRATQVRLEKWRLEQEASALQAKRLEDSKREEDRRRRETALVLKERRRAEIYALNGKLREEEERRVEMYRQERERRDQESGAAGSGPYAAAPVSGHHLAA